jgi:sarcosine oxidase subunit alpha
MQTTRGQNARATTIEHLKRYTTLGIATDRGENASVTGIAIMAELSGRGIDATGTTTFRPPSPPW